MSYFRLGLGTFNLTSMVPRRVRIIASAPVLASWVENHPLRDDPDAPLWVNLSTRNRYHVLTYEGAKAVLKRTARRVGLKKRIYSHLLGILELRGWLTFSQRLSSSSYSDGFKILGWPLSMFTFQGGAWIMLR